MPVLSIFYCICYYYIDFIEFSLFINIAIFIYSFNGGYIRWTIFISTCFCILSINLVNAFFLGKNLNTKNLKGLEVYSEIVVSFISLLWIFFILMWSLYIYWEEKYRKLEFWFSIKKVKEFSKLKSILHILMPAFVRERIRQGQRFIADD